jgi:hypothetical protein
MSNDWNPNKTHMEQEDQKVQIEDNGQIAYTSYIGYLSGLDKWICYVPRYEMLWFICEKSGIFLIQVICLVAYINGNMQNP